MLQEEHDKRRVQLVEQTAPDHFIRDLRDQECWRCISYQESNNNSFFSTSMKLVGQFRDNKINILECATKLGRVDRMYSAQYSPHRRRCIQVHSGGRRTVYQPVGRCSRLGPVAGGGWLCEKDYHAMASELLVLPAFTKGGQRRTHRREHQTTYSGGVFDLRVGEWSVW